MYFYYMMSAMGPQYQKFLWWKQHLTTLQMVQFVAIMVHAFQLVFYDDCDFPWQFALYIGAHGLLFFVLFSQFYVKKYFKKIVIQQQIFVNQRWKMPTTISKKTI